MTFALVCVDIANSAVDRLFNYSIPDNMQVQVGMRVKVPFGSRSKPIDGYVIDISNDCEIPHSKIKAIHSLYEPYPLFSAQLLSLAYWMKDKYYTTLANCLNCILPPGLSSKPWEALPPKPSARGLDPLTPSLTLEQEMVVADIVGKLETNIPQTVLIHGVTGSGKTEVYMQTIAKVLEMGKQAIVLVPEIALTPQTVAAFTKRFGDMAAVTHSRMTAKERLNQWHRARIGEVRLMIGPRSAVFTPFDNLGIIIIDEEHEHSYRSENTPKFDARQVAEERCRLSSSLLVMGSATPSLESYHRAETGQISLLNMSQRVNGMFPKVNIIDMRKELAAGNASIFGREFQDEMASTLEQKQQVILFLNRRGHSSFMSCRRCGYVMGCDNCRVNLTYHAADERLLCHYCGRATAIPKICPSCESPFMRYFGVGTQKIEEEVTRLFPKATALRMDMDTTKSKNGHAKILNAFKKGEAQILIGTQMIAKGLDFPNVTLVGIVAADLSLFSGDFRAAEHTFQLLTQVSGRAGRAEQLGRVYIQTYNPENYSIAMAKDADYKTFYSQEITIRRTMEYPPFAHVFMIMFTGPDEKALIMALHKLLAIMRYCNKKGLFEMIGPAPAFVSRLKKQFRWRILVKCSKTDNPEEILKQFVLYCLSKLKENDPLKGMTINITLDPMILE